MGEIGVRARSGHAGVRNASKLRGQTQRGGRSCFLRCQSQKDLGKLTRISALYSPHPHPTGGTCWAVPKHILACQTHGLVLGHL